VAAIGEMCSFIQKSFQAVLPESRQERVQCVGTQLF
jgi:hypothetical protein